MLRRFTLFLSFLMVLAVSDAQSLQASFSTFPPSSSGTLVVCAGENVAFINTTVGDDPTATYSWDFGTGATPATSDSDGTVVVQYSYSGALTTASLTVQNLSGETSTFSISVNVLASPISELSLLPDELDFYESLEDGVLTFTHCNSDGPQLLSLDCNEDNTVSQTFGWGDGSPDSDESAIIDGVISHTYPVGDFELEHYIQYDNGCSEVRNYRIFNGSAPIVTVSGSGQNTCTPSPYQIEIISNNVPIDYTISYSDIFDVEDFTTANDTTLQHTFFDNSCGEEYVISPVLPPIQNAYSATLIASNLCSANGIPTVVTIGPITVSSAPEPVILPVPAGPICQSQWVNLTSVGLPGETVTINGCNDTTLTYWSIEEISGYFVQTGDLGASNGATGIDYEFGEWSPGSENITLGFNEPGSYHVWLHTGNGCGEDSTQYVVQVNPYGDVLPNLEFTQICSGDTVDPIVWTSTIPNYLITWNADVPGAVSGMEVTQGTGIGPLESPDDWILTNESNQSAYVTVQATVNCTNTEGSLWTIEIFPEINLEKGPLDMPVCSGEVWDVEVGTNVDGVTLSWTPDSPSGVSGATSGSGDLLGDLLVNSTNNVQTVIYTITTPDEDCPMDPVEYELEVWPEAQLPNLTDLSFCSGEEIQLDDYNISVAGKSWSWENSNTDIGLPGSGDGILDGFTANENQTGQSISSELTIIAQVADCPAEELIIDLTLYPDPEAEFVVSPDGGVNCITQEGTIVTETTAANPTFDWSGSNLLTATGGTATVGAPGDYQVEITDGNTGCSATFDVEVLDAVPINITDVDFQPPNCAGGNDGWIEISTDGGNDIQFNWTPGGIEFDEGYAEGLSAGVYSLVVTNGSACSDEVEVELIDFDPLAIELVQFIDSECGEANGMLEVVASGGQGNFDYHWGVFQNDALLDGIDAGLYEVEATDAGGCTISDTYELDCYPLTPIEVSQLVTPNQDGFNDNWYVEYLWMYPNHKVQIFNRWGNLVYEAEPYNNDWDGRWDPALGSSKLLPAGTYYYLIDTRKKSQAPFRGFIELQHEQR
ncbi:MAG: gliding motility-associated C-terminal domain-containing protein [Bacteroidetes bacterium]|nr:gliding motility-associated C-terminal domain-containing protein [Bacteroidota bacterium]MDA1335711.1 gliding motility-associated C-terminal domain-containing protein [Bacteroidota bacterium]